MYSVVEYPEHMDSIIAAAGTQYYIRALSTPPIVPGTVAITLQGPAERNTTNDGPPHGYY
jgi:hypothetical protein